MWYLCIYCHVHLPACIWPCHRQLCCSLPAALPPVFATNTLMANTPQTRLSFSHCHGFLLFYSFLFLVLNHSLLWAWKLMFNRYHIPDLGVHQLLLLWLRFANLPPLKPTLLKRSSSETLLKTNDYLPSEPPQCNLISFPPCYVFVEVLPMFPSCFYSLSPFSRYDFGWCAGLWEKHAWENQH